MCAGDEGQEEEIAALFGDLPATAGMGFAPVALQPVRLHTVQDPQTTPAPTFLLEFQPTLAFVSRVPAAMEFAVKEAAQMLQPKTLSEYVNAIPPQTHRAPTAHATSCICVTGLRNDAFCVIPRMCLFLRLQVALHAEN